MEPESIRLHRILQGKSQLELAKAAGISFSYVSLIENGARPSRVVMQRIERALGFAEEGGSDE